VSFLATLRIALSALRVNKLRSALTMLGIIIGVAAVITMVAVGAGAQARVEDQIRSLGSNLIIILSGNFTAGGRAPGLRGRRRRSPRTTPMRCSGTWPDRGRRAAIARQRPGRVRNSNWATPDPRHHARVHGGARVERRERQADRNGGRRRRGEGRGAGAEPSRARCSATPIPWRDHPHRRVPHTVVACSSARARA